MRVVGRPDGGREGVHGCGGWTGAERSPSWSRNSRSWWEYLPELSEHVIGAYRKYSSGAGQICWETSNAQKSRVPISLGAMLGLAPVSWFVGKRGETGEMVLNGAGCGEHEGFVHNEKLG